MVRINVHGAKLIARVDNITAETIIAGLDPNTNYGVTSDLTSVVLIGGEYRWFLGYNYLATNKIETFMSPISYFVTCG